MRITSFALTLAISGSLALGCGGSTTNGGGGAGGAAGASGASGGGGTSGGGGGAAGNSGAGGAAGTAGAAGIGGNGGGGPTGCPGTEPTGATPCNAAPDIRCTYGDSVRPDCRHDWLCHGGQWTTTKSVCIQPPQDHCAFPSAPSGVCKFDGDVCTFDETICICTSCAGGPCMVPPPKWACSPPPSNPDCPRIVPNDGAACPKEGTECTYGHICTGSGAQVICKGGAWRWRQDIACAL